MGYTRRARRARPGAAETWTGVSDSPAEMRRSSASTSPTRRMVARWALSQDPAACQTASTWAAAASATACSAARDWLASRSAASALGLISTRSMPSRRSRSDVCRAATMSSPPRSAPAAAVSPREWRPQGRAPLPPALPDPASRRASAGGGPGVSPAIASSRRPLAKYCVAYAPPGPVCTRGWLIVGSNRICRLRDSCPVQP